MSRKGLPAGCCDSKWDKEFCDCVSQVVIQIVHKNTSTQEVTEGCSLESYVGLATRSYYAGILAMYVRQQGA